MVQMNVSGEKNKYWFIITGYRFRIKIVTPLENNIPKPPTLVQQLIDSETLKWTFDVLEKAD